jgi:hypothetical protein
MPVGRNFCFSSSLLRLFSSIFSAYVFSGPTAGNSFSIDDYTPRNSRLFFFERGDKRKKISVAGEKMEVMKLRSSEGRKKRRGFL